MLWRLCSACGSEALALLVSEAPALQPRWPFSPLPVTPGAQLPSRPPHSSVSRAPLSHTSRPRCLRDEGPQSPPALNLVNISELFPFL